MACWSSPRAATSCSPVTPEETPEEYLAFALESECYAVPIRSIREIGKVPPLTETAPVGAAACWA